MEITKELNEILILSKESVLSNSKGELILPLRKKIWRVLGEFEFDENNKALQSIGLKRRVKLASLCVNKVMDKWSIVRHEDTRPKEMLNLAEEYILGNIQYKEAKDKLNDFLNDLINLSSNENLFYIVEVGYAAIKTLDLALNEEMLINLGNEESLDDDLDSYNWDSSYFSAIAYSGSGSWDNTNIKKRQEFWLWYINEAIQQAYLSYRD